MESNSDFNKKRIKAFDENDMLRLIESICDDSDKLFNNKSQFITFFKQNQLYSFIRRRLPDDDQKVSVVSDETCVKDWLGISEHSEVVNCDRKIVEHFSKSQRKI